MKDERDAVIHIELRLGSSMVVFDGPAEDVGPWIAFWLGHPSVRTLPELPRVVRLFVWPSSRPDQ